MISDLTMEEQHQVWQQFPHLTEQTHSASSWNIHSSTGSSYGNPSVHHNWAHQPVRPDCSRQSLSLYASVHPIEQHASSYALAQGQRIPLMPNQTSYEKNFQITGPIQGGILPFGQIEAHNPLCGDVQWPLRPIYSYPNQLHPLWCPINYFIWLRHKLLLPVFHLTHNYQFLVWNQILMFQSSLQM